MQHITHPLQRCLLKPRVLQIWQSFTRQKSIYQWRRAYAEEHHSLLKHLLVLHTSLYLSWRVTAGLYSLFRPIDFNIDSRVAQAPPSSGTSHLWKLPIQVDLERVQEKHAGRVFKCGCNKPHALLAMHIVSQAWLCVALGQPFFWLAGVQTVQQALLPATGLNCIPSNLKQSQECTGRWPVVWDTQTDCAISALSMTSGMYICFWIHWLNLAKSTMKRGRNRLSLLLKSDRTPSVNQKYSGCLCRQRWILYPIVWLHILKRMKVLIWCYCIIR